MCDGNKDPDRDHEGRKGDDLCPPRGNHDIRRNVGPIEGKVQESHSSQATGYELDGIITWSKPAEGREGGGEGEGVLGQEGPEEDTDEDTPKDTDLFSGNSKGLTLATEGAVKGRLHEC